ncbi:MAG: radical SAM protein [Firmicutes bacterium]|nr:radical SAM protein [Bacillota bacterium]
MANLIFIELRRLTSNRKTKDEMVFLGSRYATLKKAGFLPEEFRENEYEDIRHLIVGGWVNALSYHLQEHDCSVVFITKDSGPFPELLQNAGNAPIFLISIMSGNFLQAQKVTEYIRNNCPDATIIVGGVHPTLCPEETAEILSPDYMVVGEADEFISPLIENAIKRTPFLHDGVWNKNMAPPNIKQVSSDPSKFEWSWKLHHQYSHPANRNIVNYVSTRSCPFHCHFCGIVKTKYQEMSPEKVIAQIKGILDFHESVWIHWETPCCFYDQKITENILQGIKEFKIHFAGQHRVEEPTPERRKLYQLAAEAGLDNLFVGIESVQDNVLNKMNKRNKSHFVEPFLKALKDAGITVNSGWIIGIPGQTKDDVKRDMETAVNLISQGIMAVALPQYLEIYPGTWFWNNAAKLGITLHCDVTSYDKITREVAHSTSELSKDEIWDLYCEFLATVASVIK